MPSPTYSEPANPCRFSLFPPAFVRRAARPRAATPPADATPKACVCRSRRSGGSPLAVAGRRRGGLGLRCPACGRGVLNWRHGVGRLCRRPRTRWGGFPAALGRLRCVVCRQMRGGRTLGPYALARDVLGILFGLSGARRYPQAPAGEAPYTGASRFLLGDPGQLKTDGSMECECSRREH